MLLAIISAVLAYRKARNTGRNGILWAVIAAATFIGTQLIVALVLGLVAGVVLVSMDRTEADLDKFNILITILAVIFSFGTTWLVLKYLDKVPQENTFTAPPPPPENFN
jgi:ABC-type glycerol-3-phosphate transport system permease component